ncbi:MAG: BON domain-containing protein [Terriglobales bacterium]
MRYQKLTAAGAAVVLALAMAACSKSNAGSQDQAITQSVQKNLNADNALQGDNIIAATQNGVVTLSGTVTSNAARTQAAQDAQVPGVTQVDNQIATNTPANPAATAGSAMSAQPPSPSRRRETPASASQPAAPAAPATVEIDSGRTLAVRLSQQLSSADAQPGQNWQGQISTPVRVNGQIAIPQGAAVSGTIVAADASGKFRGRSRLVLRLTTLEFNGASYDLSSKEITRETSARGSNTAKKIGIGAAIGTAIGAIAGGGKGAALGAAAGAGTGTAAQEFSKAPEVNLPSETVLQFSLAAPLKVVPAASAGN